MFGAENDVLRFPERLCFDKVDTMFRFVAFALLPIELELHTRLLAHFDPRSERSLNFPFPRKILK
jgi:hypothetical protein